MSQFDNANPVATFTNTISTLLYGYNFLKIYENYFGEIKFSKRFENGLRYSASAVYEDRLPLDNSTNFVVFKNDSSNITPNYPIEKLTSQFTRHQALVLNFEVSIKPGQKYIQFPNRKMSLGSNYPTFTLGYSKGIYNVLGIKDDKNFKLAGLLKYKVGVGGFLNTKKVFIQDYQHFIGNQSISASEYVNSFQIADYYANSTMSSFYGYVHVEHHLNGLLTNKIPLFKRLNWNLVAGANAIYVDKNYNYSEVFVGLENVLKIFRIDVVRSFVNGSVNATHIKIGTGGI